jgi:hypothetical protein
VEARVAARMVELALVVGMQQWLAAIDPDAPFRDLTPVQENGSGMG